MCGFRCLQCEFTENEEELKKLTQALDGMQQKEKWQWAPRVEESLKLKTLFILRMVRCWIRLPREAGESPVHGDTQTLSNLVYLTLVQQGRW